MLPPAAGLQLRTVVEQPLILLYAVKRESKKHRLAVPIYRLIYETSI